MWIQVSRRLGGVDNSVLLLAPLESAYSLNEEVPKIWVLFWQSYDN